MVSPFPKLTKTSLLMSLLLSSSCAWSTDYTWVGTTNTHWETASNWSPSVSPGIGDTAILSDITATGRVIDLSTAGLALDKIMVISTGGNFNLNILTAANFVLASNTSGGILDPDNHLQITINRAATMSLSNTGSTLDHSTIINNGVFLFTGGSGTDSPSAGSTTFTNNGILAFDQSATAGSSIITNTANGSITLSNDSTAGQSQLTNNGILSFVDNASAGTSTITNSSTSYIDFQGDSTSGSATINNNSASFFFHTSNSNAGSGQINNTGTMQFTQGTTTTYSGLITGTGILFHTGTGTTILTNHNTYRGTTSIANGGTVEFQGNTADIGNIFVNTNSHVVFNPVAPSSYGMTITGPGTVTKNGTNLFSISGNHTVSGDTTINDGTFNLNGSMGQSNFTVAAGASLTGNGTVNDLTNSGTIKPGNSIGTTVVLGNLTLNNTSVYQAELAPSGASDLIQVTGNANLDGNLILLSENGPLPAGTTFTILTANSISNAFASITHTPGLSLEVLYKPTLVQVVITPQAFVNNSLQGKAQDLGKYLDKIAGQISPTSDLAAVIALIHTLPAHQVQTALERIQPSVLASLGDMTDRISGIVAKGTTTEMRILRTQNQLRHTITPLTGALQDLKNNFVHLIGQTSQSISAQMASLWHRPSPKHHGLAIAPSQQPLPKEMRTQWGKTSLWIQQTGQYFQRDHAKKSVGLLSRTASIAGGLDLMACDHLLVGMMGSMSRSHFNWSHGHGRGGISSYHLGLYSSWISPQKTWYVDLAGFLGRHRYNSYRKIKFPGLSKTAAQNHWGTELASTMEVGHTFYLPYQWTMEPYVQGGYLFLHENNFKEHGAQGLNIHGNHKNRHFARINPGLEVAHMTTTAQWIVRPAMRLGYSYHGKSHRSGQITGSLKGQRDHFTVTSSTKGRHLWTGSLSLAALSHGGFYVHGVYNAEVNGEEKTHEGLIRLGWKF